jgi:hypothetical protein
MLQRTGSAKGSVLFVFGLDVFPGWKYIIKPAAVVGKKERKDRKRREWTVPERV